MDDHIALWDRLHEILPPGWRVPSAPSFDPATMTWERVAIGLPVGGRRGGPPESIVGTGNSEVNALRGLVVHLEGGA